ncbi:phosphodiester glycosidase family protein [Fusibacter bizertensis]
MMKPYRFAIIYGLVLTLVSSGVLIDTFLIPHSLLVIDQSSDFTDNVNRIEVTSVSQEATKQAEVENKNEGAYTENAYTDDHLQINIQKVASDGMVYYVADIQTDDPSLLKTALAYDTYGKNVTEATSDIASAHNAIFAVNGDYYGFRNTGYVLRNGLLMRSTEGSSGTEALVIDKNGDFSIVYESEVSAEDLESSGAQQIISFGPALVIDGKAVERNTKNGGQNNPRTAIGQISKGHYLFVVVDGRTSESKGATLSVLAQIFLDYGCETAYNLDGGGSATMWFNGEVVNTPTDGRSYDERKVSDIVYFGY